MGILLDSLAEHPRAAIRGAAGTGKTVLAMEKAHRMALAGKRVSLLCFNKPLAAHLDREAGGEFTVETFHDFCRRLAQRAKLPFKPPKGSERIAIVSTRTLKNSPFAGDHRAGRFLLLNLDDSRSWKKTPSPRGGSTGRVVFDTLDRFKGLERDVVILLDLPSESRSITPRHRYAAASRARNLLMVVRLAAAEPRAGRTRGTLRPPGDDRGTG